MNNRSHSPSPGRWFKAIRRTRLEGPCLKIYTLDCVDLLRRARVAFQTGHTLKENFRLAQLGNLLLMLEEHDCEFVDALGKDLHKTCITRFYGCDPQESHSFGRIVNMEVFNRTRDMLWRSGKVVVGGPVIETEKYIAPTILTEVTESDPILQQDIFGPVLPVLSVNDLDEAIAIINKQEKPLCVYAYSSNSEVITRLMTETSSGSFCSNVLQSLMVALPFGGVGASGLGSCHGHYSFDTFSHRKSCLLRSIRFECITYLHYPPYEDRNLSLMTWASTLSQRSQGWCQIL